MIDAGTRIRLRDSVPWESRRGCEGVVVYAPNGPGVYPDDPRNPDQVIVLLDEDPLIYAGHSPSWTCVVQHRDVEVLS